MSKVREHKSNRINTYGSDDESIETMTEFIRTPNAGEEATNFASIQEYPFDSPLVGKYIKLKKVIMQNPNRIDDDGLLVYQIQSISSPALNDGDESEKQIPELVRESTNQWLLSSSSYTCADRAEQIKFFNALSVVVVQICSYLALVYYLVTLWSAEQAERTQACYGPNCDIEQTPCMDIKTGTVTAILLLGFLLADFINTFEMLVDCFSGCKLLKTSQFIGCSIILIELLMATFCGILVGIYSTSDWDAINGAIGILAVHDLDEKIYLAMNVIQDHYKKILALLLWVLISWLIAMSSACIYDDEFWFGGSSGHCKAGEFKCGNGECIWAGFQCNGYKECTNAMDENQNCNFDEITCPADMFKCVSNGMCIDVSKKCDGVLDCDDGSDEAREADCSSLLAEIDCGPPPTFVRKYADNDWYLRISEGGFFKCKNGQCIDGRYVCDSIVDCVDGSDEYPLFESLHNWPQLRQCPYTKLIECANDEVLCKANGKCIGKLRVCDGINDCPNGEDERHCPWVWGDPWCEFLNKFQCGGQIAKIINDSAFMLFENQTIISYSGADEMLAAYFVYSGGTGPCLPMQYRCDGIRDCDDGSDEQMCELFECDAEVDYQCPNGECIPLDWDCTHIPYCKDIQYDGGFFSNCDWRQNITSMECGDIVYDAISQDGGYFNRYDVFIPCPYSAVQFTTCNNYTKITGFDSVIQGWDEDTMTIHFANDNAEWFCEMNYFASTVTLNSDVMKCDRTYTLMVGGKYQQESFGSYAFEVICSNTDFESA